MEALRHLVHRLAIAITKVVNRLVPDRVPLTFAGSDATGELVRTLASTGEKKMLIVTDKDLVSLGLVERVTERLNAAGIDFAVFDGVEPDPTFAQVEAGLAELERSGCNSILAIGGGSPMDAAKIIAASATSKKPTAKLEGLMKIRETPLPLYAIPTTAGTGSEVTIAAVVSDTATHTKKFFVDPNLLPQMTALDASLMTGLPPKTTAATGMDALTHAVESYLSETSRPQTEQWATAAVRLIFRFLPRAYKDGNDTEAREAMALASYYAGLAFTRTGVGYVHAIAHAFGARYGTPHGLANAIALPPVLDYSESAARARLAELGEGYRPRRQRGRRTRVRVHRSRARPRLGGRHSRDAGRPRTGPYSRNRRAGRHRGLGQLPGPRLHDTSAVRATVGTCRFGDISAKTAG